MTDTRGPQAGDRRPGAITGRSRDRRNGDDATGQDAQLLADVIMQQMMPDYLNCLPRLLKPEEIKSLNGLILALTIPGGRD